MKETAEVVNKGYLREPYRLFHLRDRSAPPVETHFHEFDKVVLLYSGAVEYTVEGVSYALRPGDVLFVKRHDVHRPVIALEPEYERVILWIRPERLAGIAADCDLGLCFDRASEERACLYRPPAAVWDRLRRIAGELERAGDGGFGAETLGRALLLQLMVELNRCVLMEEPGPSAAADRQIDAVLRHISAHLAGPLSVEELAGQCYLSRYYFMRRFKAVTGYTVHSYVSLRRMTEAARLLSSGVPAGEAAAAVGFADYSSFLRAFRRQFGVTPGEFAQNGAPVFDTVYE